MPFKYILVKSLLMIVCMSGVSCQEDPLTMGESTTITPLIDSNTNWLLACAEDDDCSEGGQCSCGTCVIPCQPEVGCQLRLGDEQMIRVECQESNKVLSELGCGNDMPVISERMCIPSCEIDADCPATFRCREDHCIPPPRMRDERCEEACLMSNRDSRRCYVECQRAQRRRQEEEYRQMSMMDGTPPPPPPPSSEMSDEMMED